MTKDAKNGAKSDETKKLKEIDTVSGVETTGHEWDGLKELNNPAPRWWLWVFYVTVIWSVWYWVVYPAWPTLDGATKGSYGWTQYKKLAEDQAEIADRQKVYLEKFEKASFEEILGNPEMYAFAVAGGTAAFKDNCATCHGTGGAGGKGYPNLNDDDWLWGGSLQTIYETILYGIRSQHDETRVSQMPAFGVEELLTTTEINAVVDYVVSLSGQTNPHEGENSKIDVSQGQEIFALQCASCHGEDGKGNREVGAPNLTDNIWLYGGDRETVYKTVFNARAGVMPTWKARLDDNTIRQLAVYVHQLGGGEPTVTKSVVETPVTPDPAAPINQSQPENKPLQEPSIPKD